MENGGNNLALDYDLYSYDGIEGYSKSMSNDDVTVRSANHIDFPSYLLIPSLVTNLVIYFNTSLHLALHSVPRNCN